MMYQDESIDATPPGNYFEADTILLCNGLARSVVSGAELYASTLRLESETKGSRQYTHFYCSSGLQAITDGQLGHGPTYNLAVLEDTVQPRYAFIIELERATIRSNIVGIALLLEPGSILYDRNDPHTLEPSPQPGVNQDLAIKRLQICSPSIPIWLELVTWNIADESQLKRMFKEALEVEATDEDYTNKESDTEVFVLSSLRRLLDFCKDVFSVRFRLSFLILYMFLSFWCLALAWMSLFEHIHPDNLLSHMYYFV
jgi:hypothetical protein